MLKVKGVYDGTHVRLLEPVPLQANTPVEVLIVEEKDEEESAYWRRLIELGLVKGDYRQPGVEHAFAPVRIVGEPISQTIIKERR